jgi:hypothetical protein
MDADRATDVPPQPSAWALLADLPFRVESYATERHELDVSSGFLRATTVVALRGGGFEGSGEDVTYAADQHDDYPQGFDLAGDWTVASFSDHVGGLDLFPRTPPQEEFYRPYRRWGFESAALDLALRSNGLSLAQAVRREFRPVRFAVSTRLDITPWLEVDPTLEFKLDPTPEWDLGLMRRIAETGRVRVLDFKSFYQGSPVDNPPDPVQYRDAVETFPGTVLEDPALDGPAREALAGEEERFSFDAPVHSWRDVEELTARVWERAQREPAMPADGSLGAPAGPALRHLNIKPSRFGSLRALLECIERAQAAGMELYGGGQFELSVGRDHIQALASLFYPDGSNDVAPREYHGAAHADVPRSPLVPVPGLDTAPGFGFAFRR